MSKDRVCYLSGAHSFVLRFLPFSLIFFVRYASADAYGLYTPWPSTVDLVFLLFIHRPLLCTFFHVLIRMTFYIPYLIVFIYIPYFRLPFSRSAFDSFFALQLPACMIFELVVFYLLHFEYIPQCITTATITTTTYSLSVKIPIVFVLHCRQSFLCSRLFNRIYFDLPAKKLGQPIPIIIDHLIYIMSRQLG